MGFSGSASSVEDCEVKQELGRPQLAIRIPDGSVGDGSSFNVPQPLDCLMGSPVPPFLSKTYDLVDDPALDGIISWGAGGESFVVWDPVDFSRIVLPRNFKHNNFSSFVRQLNTYVGITVSQPVLAAARFRKIDADKWEFSNKGFVRGKKHLLKSIQRRKSPQSHQESYFEYCAEAVRPGLEDELERLRKERKMLMHEVAELQIEQDGTAHHMELVNQRIQVAERKQNQMVKFISKLFQNPAFLARLQSKKTHSQIESPKMKRKFITQQPHVAGLNIEKEIAKSLPDQSNLYESSIMPDAPSVSIPQLPDYLLEDLVGKLDEDDENIPLLKEDLLAIALPTSKELAALEGFTKTPEGTSEILKDSKTQDSIFKGKGKVDSLDNFSPDYLVSFPEDMGMEKSVHGLSTSGAESSRQQEDAWSMEFDANMIITSPSTGLWDNVADYSMPGFGGSSSFSDVWEFGSPHSAGLALGSPDECRIDELDVQVDQTEDGVNKYMYQ